MLILDEHSFLLVLLSLTKQLLQRKEPSRAMDAIDLDAQAFAGFKWSDLALDGHDQKLLHRALRTMFPQNESELADIAAGRDDALFDGPQEMAEAVYARWHPGERIFTYKSSGTTGLPKLLPHPLEDMEQELEELDGIFQGVKRIFALTPQYHCYGFTFGVVLHKHLGVPQIILPPFPTVVRHALQSCGEASLVIGYPDFWEQMLRSDFTPPAGTICLSAGSPWDDGCIRGLMERGYAVVEIFGSSENGTMGFRRGAEDFNLMGYWTPAKEADNVEVCLDRVLPSGKHIRHVFQDVLDWTGPRTFRPVRRKDFAVQVSGINVYPMLIAKIIESDPGVRHCRVRLMRPEEGKRLKAFIVPESGVDERELKERVRTGLKERLSAPEMPVQFTFGEALPKSGFGKETDW